MTIKEWFEKAKTEKFAIGAFNAASLETVKAVCMAASNLKSPVIIETSPGETKYIGAYNLVSVVRNFQEELGIEVFINLDHAKTYDDVMVGIEAGYDLIHFDGSEIPYDENVKLAKRVVEEAHKEGILVEGEMDRIGGSSEMHEGSASEVRKGSLDPFDLDQGGLARDDTVRGVMTDPVKALEFVQETGIDTFAVSIGNVHGVFSNGGEDLNIGLLSNIREVLPCFFSLHGGSGIPVEQVKSAIEYGIVKINVNTELRLAYRKTLENVLKGDPEEVAMYKLMPPVIEAVSKVVEEKIEVFGSGNRI